jgi:hypothetical protein
MTQYLLCNTQIQLLTRATSQQKVMTGTLPLEEDEKGEEDAKEEKDEDDVLNMLNSQKIAEEAFGTCDVLPYLGRFFLNSHVCHMMSYLL